MALCVNPAQGANKIGSVGMPLPDVSVRIFDARGGHARCSRPERSAKSALAGPQLMGGYWNRPDETAPASCAITPTPRSVHARGWLHTGDLGYLDEDGYLFIVDRKKDLIKTSGFQVWPREIEEVLATHPAVAEVGVAGVSDPVKGEVVHAWVVLRAGQTVDAKRSCARSAGNVSRLQGAGPRRVPRRAAEDDGREGAAAGAEGGHGVGVTCLQSSACICLH